MDETVFTHPLELAFGISPGSTRIPVPSIVSNPPVLDATEVAIANDEAAAADKEIDTKLTEIYDAAMETFRSQTDMVEIVDPKFAARNAEVAGQYLNTALAAVSVKAKVKAERDKSRNAGQVAGVINNTQNVFANRNELLRSMLTLDGEVVEKKL